MRNLWRALCLVLALWGGALAAQSEDGPDYAQWQIYTEYAQRQIDGGSVSNGTLESIRGRVSEWRDRFTEAQSVNGARIATVEEQIAALGPAPEQASDEDAEIQARRAALKSELAELRAPVLRAEEASLLATGQIGQIDTLLRSREADRILTRGESPVQVSLWQRAWAHVSGYVGGLLREVVQVSRDPASGRDRVDALPVTLMLLGLGMLLLLRGAPAVRRLGVWARSVTRRGTGVWSLVISLGQIVLPFLGLVALCGAILLLRVVGENGSDLVSVIPGIGALWLGMHWLAGRLFPADDRPAPLMIDAAGVTPLRRVTSWFALPLAARELAEGTVGAPADDPAVHAALLLPSILVLAFLLWRFARLMRSHRLPPESADPDIPAEPGFGDRLIRLVSMAVVGVSLVAPLLALAGFGNAATALIFPTVWTLVILGMVIVGQVFFRDLHELVFGPTEEDREALLPTLLGFGLLLLSLPVIALTWGARVTDLTELWQRFLSGVSVGDTRISPEVFLTFAIVFAAGYAATRLFQGALKSSILPKTRLDAGGRNAIISGVGYLGIFLAALLAITTAGIDLSSLAIVAGALSVGIGFGLQNVVSNFVSGIILLIERPISQGDWIEVGGQMGIVKNISVRSTRIETFDRTDVIVPNADLVSGVVTNWTRGDSVGRIIIPVGVAYGTDTRKVDTILREIARAHPMVLLRPEPSVLLRGFGADSLDFEIRAILRDVNFGLSVGSEIRHQIVERFAEEGIEVPFAQRDIWLRNPEALQPGHRSDPPVSPDAPSGSAAPVPAQDHVADEDT